MKKKNSYNESLHSGACKKLYEYGKQLRKAETTAEELLWRSLKSRKFHNLKFRRQHPLDKYVADFYCHEKKLVIELDGSIHDLKSNYEYDKARTNDLEELGIKVIRFKNLDVDNNLDTVLNQIWEIATNL